MTTGKCPNEGETLIANLIFKNADVNRGTNLELLLFTDVDATDTLTYGSLTEPATGGYARKPLTDASWTVTADTGTSTVGCIASYADQIFTPSGASWSIYGAAIVTTGTAPKILAFVIDTTVPVALEDGAPYVVRLSIPVGRLL